MAERIQIQTSGKAGKSSGGGKPRSTGGGSHPSKGNGGKQAPAFPQNKPSTTGEKSGPGRTNRTPQGANASKPTVVAAPRLLAAKPKPPAAQVRVKQVVPPIIQRQSTPRAASTPSSQSSTAARAKQPLTFPQNKPSMTGRKSGDGRTNRTQ